MAVVTRPVLKTRALHERCHWSGSEDQRATRALSLARVLKTGRHTTVRRPASSDGILLPSRAVPVLDGRGRLERATRCAVSLRH